MNSFKTELYRINFSFEKETGFALVTIIKLSGDSYQSFRTLQYLGEWITNEIKFTLSVKEAAKIMSKAAIWLLTDID
jgi:hypothetical protein